MFLLVSLSKLKFFTGVALVSFVQRSCRTFVALVLLVSYSRCWCCTRVALVSLVSGTCVVNQTRSLICMVIHNGLKSYMIGKIRKNITEQSFSLWSLKQRIEERKSFKTTYNTYNSINLNISYELTKSKKTSLSSNSMQSRTYLYFLFEQQQLPV